MWSIALHKFQAFGLKYKLMLFIYFFLGGGRVITNRKCFHATFTGFGEHDNKFGWSFFSLLYAFFFCSSIPNSIPRVRCRENTKKTSIFSARQIEERKKSTNICTQIKWNETKTSEGCLRINIWTNHISFTLVRCCCCCCFCCFCCFCCHFLHCIKSTPFQPDTHIYKLHPSSNPYCLLLPFVRIFERRKI